MERAAWSGPDGGPAARPLLGVLQRERGLRLGLVQGLYVGAALAVALTLPQLRRGPTVPAESLAPLAYGIAGGLLSFIALVFSLLFLVVQFGNTTISPRLTLFRDDPLVWHSFAFFVAVFVLCAALGLALSVDHGRVTVAVPVTMIAAVLVALGLSRALQLRALERLQFGATLEAIRVRGEAVMARYYRSQPSRPDAVTDLELPLTAEVRWTTATTMLRQVDLPALVAVARRGDGMIELTVRIGDELRRGAVVARVHGAGSVTADEIMAAFETGVDRTFRQDPLLAFRLLSDIADRALSSALNDPATAVQAVGAIHDLLTVVADKQLDFNPITDADGVGRVRLRFPTWDDFVSAGLDEVAHYAGRSPIVEARLRTLLVDLEAITPPERRGALTLRRRAWLEART